MSLGNLPVVSGEIDDILEAEAPVGEVPRGQHPSAKFFEDVTDALWAAETTWGGSDEEEDDEDSEDESDSGEGHGGRWRFGGGTGRFALEPDEAQDMWSFEDGVLSGWL